jgi:hypothetical protein
MRPPMEALRRRKDDIVMEKISNGTSIREKPQETGNAFYAKKS